jgi:UDP-glucose 4-epimerase
MPSKQLRVLVAGGAGYIGSHMVKHLARQGCHVTTLDDLSGGYRDAVLHGTLIEGDIGNRALLDQLFSEQAFDAVMHFASFIQVGESMQAPSKYYRNNLTNTLTLLDAMAAAGIQRFIFSSTAAVFGDPQSDQIGEDHPKRPINPYGRSKLMVEQALEDYDRAYGLKSVCLRYFNAAGADPEGELGERHEPETHLIPLVLQAAAGKRSHITVFGQDYGTTDGTCIRDYVHVSDLCRAHWLALQRLLQGAGSQAYNLGNGLGFSVQQVIDTARRVTGRRIEVQYAPRRAGDPARLVADARLANNELGWRPAHTSLEELIEHAWRWETRPLTRSNPG